MSIQFQCDHCSESRRVNERLAGRRIRCPGCDLPVTIPTVEQAEATRLAAESIDEVSQEAIPAALAAAIPVAAAVPMDSASRVSVNGDSATSVLISDPTVNHTADVTMTTVMSDDDDDDLGVPPRKKRDDGELDMTPMVDVTFLLLIFFMVTASFSLQKSIQMPKQTSDLPSSAQPEEPTEELDPIELEIDENGSFLVLATEWERETPGKQNLITALKEAIGDNKDGMKLNIKVHENAKLQFLVDGMDAGTIAGFAEMQVAEVDGFD
ncbi:MAG: biopolymer transporter ExbD [Planctomycetota bacterium]